MPTPPKVTSRAEFYKYEVRAGSKMPIRSGRRKRGRKVEQHNLAFEPNWLEVGCQVHGSVLPRLERCIEWSKLH